MNYRRLMSFLLALIIFLTQIGFALNIHYCGDRIAEISLAHFSANCEMDSLINSMDTVEKEFSKKTCCKDDLLLFQNHEYQKDHLEAFPEMTDLIVEFHPQLYNFNWKTPFVSKVFSKWNPPPPKSERLFLLLMSFIFYG